MQTEDNKKLFLLSKVYVSLIQLTRLYLVKYYLPPWSSWRTTNFSAKIRMLNLQQGLAYGFLQKSPHLQVVFLSKTLP